MSVRQAAELHGVTEAAIRKHARVKGWGNRPDRPTGAEVSDLVRHLQRRLVRVDHANRERCFVAAMLALQASLTEISSALGMSQRAFELEFQALLRRS
jgi:hypothetical protein